MRDSGPVARAVRQDLPHASDALGALQLAARQSAEAGWDTAFGQRLCLCSQEQ